MATRLQVGDRFGKLVIVSFPEKRLINYKVTCKCDCGMTKDIFHNQLGRRTNSCGCSRKSVEFSKKVAEINTTHGMSKTRIWWVWSDMKARCSNEKHKAYKNYGGRGITVCKRWESFENFYKDMGDPPNRGRGSNQLSLDRIDNNKGYSKSNCRWVDRKTQSNNRRK